MLKNHFNNKEEQYPNSCPRLESCADVPFGKGACQTILY